MMHLCRRLFPSILEEEGVLSKILLSAFFPSHFLYEDIKGIEVDFRNYIYSFFSDYPKEEIVTNKTPSELLKEAGYTLYECKSEDDIQRFKKYYRKNEELCSFKGGRLENNYVFFAVKDNITSIKRGNNPKREDEYGVSVISIQFTRDDSHTLSIKNRYNHTVNNPDSTFNNNLDNIIPGLTNSFEKKYGLKQKHLNTDFELVNYIKANDGKYYKFNYEINNIYYCENNIIIDNSKVIKLKNEKEILMDYFVFDLSSKKIYLYDKKINDAFIDTIGKIEKIDIIKKKDTKEIYIKEKDSRYIIVIILDKYNRIIGYKNDNVEIIDEDFMCLNKTLRYLSLRNVKSASHEFLSLNETLTVLNLPKVESVSSILCHNNSLVSLNMPNLISFYRRLNIPSDLLEYVNLSKLKKEYYNFVSDNIKNILEKKYGKKKLLKRK